MTDPLTAWLDEYAPHLAKSFAPPVQQAHVEDAEKELGRALPESYVRFLRAHDGQRWIEGEKKGVGTLAPIFDDFEILGIRHAQGEWRSMREWGGDSSERYWPFTTIGGASVHHSFDADGRVVVVSMKDPARPVLADSFDDFLTRLAALLDDERVTISEEGVALPDESVDWILGAS